MSENNGQFGGKKVFEILLDSGEYVHVQPLSIYVVRALRTKAEELFPSPDKKAYEKPLDEQKAVEPGQMIPAEENPEYQKLYDIAQEKQWRYVNDQSAMLSIEVAIGREKAIAKYQERIAQFRGVMSVPDDAWEATLKMCILTSTEDYNTVMLAVQGKTILPSEEEVRDGMRIFRCAIRKERPARRDRKQEPQSVEPVNVD